jgi:hypothetical protein
MLREKSILKGQAINKGLTALPIGVGYRQIFRAVLWRKFVKGEFYEWQAQVSPFGVVFDLGRCSYCAREGRFRLGRISGHGE